MMKKIKLVSIVSCFFLLLSSCTSEPVDSALLPTMNPPTSNNGGGTVTNGTFSTTIEGQLYTATNIQAIKHLQLDPATSTTVVSYSITGNQTSGTTGKSIVIQFDEDPSNQYQTGLDINNPVGTAFVNYINDLTAPTTTMYSSINQANQLTNTGSVNITANNTTSQLISGNFQCTVYLFDTATQQVLGTKVLTNGVFQNVHYTVQ